MPVGGGGLGNVGIKTQKKEKKKRWREEALRNHQSPCRVQVYLVSFFFEERTKDATTMEGKRAIMHVQRKLEYRRRWGSERGIKKW